MDWKLELVVVPVSDVDRAKKFYAEDVGFTLDYDRGDGEGFRFVQLTPKGSGCSIAVGLGITDAAPGSARDLHLVVPDIEAARAELAERGVNISQARHLGPDGWAPGRTQSDATTTRSPTSPIRTATPGSCRSEGTGLHPGDSLADRCAALGTYEAGIFVVFGVMLFTAQYLQLVLGMSPLRAGLWSLPSGAGLIVGSTLAPLLVRRLRPALVVTAGLMLAALGFGMLTQVGAASGLGVLVTGAFIYSAGVAPALALSTDLIIAAAPPERAGAAAAIAETGSELGGALGIALLGVIGNAVYRSQVAGTFPAGITAPAAGAARQTLAGAVTSAGQVSGQLRAGLLDAARQAFTHGLHVIAAISAGIAVGVAIVDAVMLSGIGSDSGQGKPASATGRHNQDEARKGAIG